MDRWFKTEEGEIVDVVKHTIEQIQGKEKLEIYVGTDSQNKSSKSLYATVIVYRYGIRGCHFISKSVSVPAIKDLFTRLFKEAELTVAAADMISAEVPIKFTALEFDYNGRITTKSSMCIQAAKGWASSLGYVVRVKPDPMIASKAADKVCRRDANKIKHFKNKEKRK